MELGGATMGTISKHVRLEGVSNIDKNRGKTYDYPMLYIYEPENQMCQQMTKGDRNECGL